MKFFKKKENPVKDVVVEEKKPTVMEEIYDFAKSFAKMAAVVLIVRGFVFVPTEVSGRSMQPTLNDGDHVIIWQLFYTPSLFDVVVLEYSEGVHHVKRVLGTPGDRVDYIDGELFINDELIDEPYIYDGASTRGFRLEDICHLDVCDVIPEDYFLVLGDYREGSGDSRNYGLVHRSQILGRAIWRVRPFSEFGTFN